MKSKLKFLLVSYILAITIISIILLVLNHKKIKNDDLYYQDIENNLEKEFIQRIKIQYIPCKEPYKNIFNLSFKGTDDFCYCKYIFGNIFTYVGICKNDDEEQRSCSQKYGMSSRDIENLKGFFFCGEISAFNYDEIENVDEDTKLCEKGFKVCGKDSLDFLCFLESEECPINDIIISDTKRSDLVDLKYIEQSEISPSTEEEIFLYTTNNKIENEIPVDFQLGYKNICINPGEEKSPMEQFKYLSKSHKSECKSKINSKSKDERYKKIYSLDKFQLYRNNNILQALQNYPLFEKDSLRYNIDLFSRPFIHISSKCFQKY